MLGVSIGTMALIIVLSAFNGLSDLVQSLYNSFNSDIEITIKHGKTFDPNTIQIQSIKKINGVVYFSEVIKENALLKLNNLQCIATIKGVEEGYEKMTHFDSFVKEGNFILQEQDRNFAVLGKGVSYTLNSMPGDIFSPISVYAPKRGMIASINPEDAFNEKKIYVSGIFSINDDFDYKYVMVPIGFARELLDYKNEVSSVEIGLSPLCDKDKVQKEIQESLGKEYNVKNRLEQNELLFKTLKSEKLWTFIILVFILIIATFNVIGSLTMLILEKKKDIAILWDMGASVNLLRKLFLMEGILITLIGALLGIIMGVLVCWLQIHFGLKRFGEGFIVDAFPIKMQVNDFIIVFVVVMLIGLFAAWYPVRIFTRKYMRSYKQLA